MNVLITLMTLMIMLHKVILSKIKLSFERKINKNVPINEYIEELIWNNIITKLNVGSLLKEINFSIRLQDYPLVLIGENTNTNYEKYNSKISSTYKKINDNNFISSFTFYSNFTLSEELFKIEKTFNLKFLLTNEIDTNEGIKEIGIIGLGIQDPTLNHKIIEETNLIYQLKKLNLISSNIFTIKYISENKGEIIIGNKDLIEYDNEKNYEGFNFIKTEMENGNFIWSFQINNISISNQILDNDIKIKLILELGVIKPNYIILDYLKKNYFNQLINENKCFINKTKDSLDYFYYCNKNIDIKKFPEIKFYLKNYQMEFVLDYNDLIVEYENIYFFLIIFRYYPQGFEVGFPFIKKLYLCFDLNRKFIGIFKYGKKKFHIKIVLIFCGCVIIIILLFIYFYIFRKERRKKKIYEIEDNYDYIPGKLL